jgi:hypothetical protein
VALIALIISFIAMSRTFYLKWGVGFKGTWTLTGWNDDDSDESYVSEIILENLKDRATVIFGIYLQVGKGNYIEIEDHSLHPIIIRPFEVYHKEYDPILDYVKGLQPVDIRHLLHDTKTTKQLVLSTSNGKYTVKRYIQTWDPIQLSFRNGFNWVLRPSRKSYKGRSYPKSVKYVMDFSFNNSDNRVISIRNDNGKYKHNTNIPFTNESFESTDKLKKYLQSMKRKKLFVFKNVEITEFKEPDIKPLRYRALNPNWILFHALGRLILTINRFKTKQLNRRLHNELNT